MGKVLFEEINNERKIVGIDLVESVVEKIQYIKTKAIGLLDKPTEYEYIRITISNPNHPILNKKMVVEVWDKKLFDIVMACNIGETLKITATPNIFSGKVYAAMPFNTQRISFKAITIEKK